MSITTFKVDVAATWRVFSKNTFASKDPQKRKSTSWQKVLPVLSDTKNAFSICYT